MGPHHTASQSSFRRFGAQASGWFCFTAAILALALLGGCAKTFNWRTQAGNNGSTTGPFTIGGSAIGLTGTGLVLEDNGGDFLTVSANGPFTFATAVTGAYSVIVKTQPTNPVQTCSVINGTGTASADVTNLQLLCGNVFTVGGSITGLDGSGLVLQNNLGDNLTVTGTGNVNFTFATPLVPGAAYSVTILTQPSVPTQICGVVNGSGTITVNVTNIQISCSQPKFSISGSVVGLVPGVGDTLELQNNGGDNLQVTGDTSFTFPTLITYGGLFNVQIFLPPTSQPQSCGEFGYTGITTGVVTGVLVDCQHNDWNWISWYLPSTNAADNLAAVTTPLFPPGQIAPPNVGTPGGRVFAATWTDAQGNRWLFGGNGYPFPNPLVQANETIPGFLNDLWVYDQSVGGWVPANLPIFINLSGFWQDDTTPLEVENASGFYGTLGASTGGAPGARWGSSTWTDGAGNLWMFGGQGYDASTEDFTLLNDIWEWIPMGLDNSGAGYAGTYTGEWIWQGGSSVGNQPTAAAFPGGRWAAATYTDTVGGNVYLFGGQGVDSAGKTGVLSDLWEYNIGAKSWTLVSGSTLANKNGVYGMQGMPAAGNLPGARQNAVLWVDSSGKIWLFGGFGFDSAGTGAPLGATLNDLWVYSGGQWTWVSGSNMANQNGTYGTQAMPAATNVPGSRWGAEGWTDASGNIWFFGGWGYGSITSHPQGYLNDVWEYQHSTAQWIWWKGSNDVNQTGQYLTKGIPYVNNVVGSRRGAAVWVPDAQACPVSGGVGNGAACYVWMFGGAGYDTTQTTSPGYLNDLWTYLPFP